MNTKYTRCFILIAASLIWTTSAFALTTPVSTGGDGAVSTLEGIDGILDRLYGWGNLMRIDDNDDHTFSAKAEVTYAVYGEAKYAGWTQNIGVRSSGGDQGLFSVQNNFDNGISGKEASHVGYFTLDNDEDVKFYDDSSGNPLWTTDPSDNVENPNHPDGVDLAVTYKIMNGQYKNHYVIAFEDKNANDNGDDWDFNDMVIRVAPTPEPGTVILLGLGLLGLGLGTRRRANKKE